MRQVQLALRDLRVTEAPAALTVLKALKATTATRVTKVIRAFRGSKVLLGQEASAGLSALRELRGYKVRSARVVRLAQPAPKEPAGSVANPVQLARRESRET